jgi:hypothetical protein
MQCKYHGWIEHFRKLTVVDETYSDIAKFLSRYRHKPKIQPRHTFPSLCVTARSHSANGIAHEHVNYLDANAQQLVLAPWHAKCRTIEARQSATTMRASPQREAREKSSMSNSQSGYREGEILAGKYRIERVLGAGGMGAVLAATPSS